MFYVDIIYLVGDRGKPPVLIFACLYFDNPNDRPVGFEYFLLEKKDI